MRTWTIDTNVGKTGFPACCCDPLVEIHLPNTPKFLQIEAGAEALSFLRLGDIEVIDEVNECGGELLKAVSRLSKGESYHVREAGVTIVAL